MNQTKKSVHGLLMAVALVSVVLRESRAETGQEVRLLRVPDGGIQPKVVVDRRGIVHMIYYQGDATHGDVHYVRSSNEGKAFSAPRRVNSQPGSAIAAGTIRGGQIAVGDDGRVHVAWNGSTLASPKGPLDPGQPAESPYNGAPMLYTRMNDAGAAFEAQRNVMQRTFALDGGGAVAVTPDGTVCVAWHAASADGPEGEAGRRVWITRSTDGGKTFTAEQPASSQPTGACACCALSLFADHEGSVHVLYRAAWENVHRDMYLLTARENAQRFDPALIDRWEISSCPMSSAVLTEGPQGLLAAWETAGQVYFSTVMRDSPGAVEPIAAPRAAKGRKHPALATNAQGQTLLVWTEGTGWKRGGSLAWQVYDRTGKPTKLAGTAQGVPVWSFAAAFSDGNGNFTIVY